MDDLEISKINFAAEVVSFFLPADKLMSVNRLGDGNINDTFLVEFSSRSPVVLQQINSDVFPDPARVADNVRLVTEHIRQKMADGLEGKTVWVIQTEKGDNCHRDGQNNVWRMINYIENTLVHSSVVSAERAFEAGKILGSFHHYLDDLPLGVLKEPLPGFHNLPRYCSHYREVRQGYDGPLSVDLLFCIGEADKRIDQGYILEDLYRRGKISRRVIHGDPKLANILFDADSAFGVTMIDLDTVFEGLLQYDLGDCLRSVCNSEGESPGTPEDVVFDLDLCEQLLVGYGASGASISENEQSLVYQGVRMLTYELAVRFLSDYLEGSRYFKVRYEGENLKRALTQFHLLHSIEEKQREIELLASEVMNK